MVDVVVVDVEVADVVVVDVVVVVVGHLHSGGHSGFSQLQINSDLLCRPK